MEVPEERESLNLRFTFFDTFRVDIAMRFAGEKLMGMLYKRDKRDAWAQTHLIDDIAFDKILELKVPLNTLELTPEKEFGLLLSVEKNGMVVEIVPARGPLVITVPREDFESYVWSA